eukprot:5091723-Pyramimonas_sp.AAC.1
MVHTHTHTTRLLVDSAERNRNFAARAWVWVPISNGWLSYVAVDLTKIQVERMSRYGATS